MGFSLQTVQLRRRDVGTAEQTAATDESNWCRGSVNWLTGADLFHRSVPVQLLVLCPVLKSEIT